MPTTTSGQGRRVVNDLNAASDKSTSAPVAAMVLSVLVIRSYA